MSVTVPRLLKFPLPWMLKKPEKSAIFYLTTWGGLYLGGPASYASPEVLAVFSSPYSRRRRPSDLVDGTEQQERDPGLRHSRKSLPRRGGGPPKVAEGVL